MTTPDPLLCGVRDRLARNGQRKEKEETEGQHAFHDCSLDSPPCWYSVSQQAAKKCNKKRRKSFLQGLKPVESTQFTAALKHRPPKESESLLRLPGLTLTKDEFVAGLARPVSFVQCRIPWHTEEECCVKLCLPSTCLLVQADRFYRALRLALAAKAQKKALPG